MLANMLGRWDWYEHGLARPPTPAERRSPSRRSGPGFRCGYAEGDPTRSIVGDDAVMVIDAQATPVMAHEVIQRVAGVTDKPIWHGVADIIMPRAFMLLRHSSRNPGLRCDARPGLPSYDRT